MAKGSLYFYFKSKDELLVSIIDYYGEMLFVQMREFPSEAGLPPREKLALQLERQVRFFREHLDFMKMLLKEPLTGLHPHIREMVVRMRARSSLWYATHILEIYGEAAEKSLGDSSALLAGVGAQYFEALLFENRVFDEWRLSRYLVDRFDDLMEGVLNDGGPAILPPPDLALLRELAGLPKAEASEELGLIQELADELLASTAGRDSILQADLLGALSQLREEAEKPESKHRLLVRSMLAFLKANVPSDAIGKIDRLEQGLVVGNRL